MINICRKALFYEQLRLGKISFFEVPLSSCQERCHPLEAFYASFAKATWRLVCWVANGSFIHTKSGCFQQRIEVLQRFGFAMRASS